AGGSGLLWCAERLGGSAGVAARPENAPRVGFLLALTGILRARAEQQATDSPSWPAATILPPCARSVRAIDGQSDLPLRPMTKTALPSGQGRQQSNVQGFSCGVGPSIAPAAMEHRSRPNCRRRG